MAWIEMHQSLITHRKTLTLADELETSTVAALGHLFCLWAWALDNAPDGSLAHVRPKTLAQAGQWRKRPEDFLGALIVAGFIDQPQDGPLALHDWDEYAGRLMYQRERNKRNAKAYRHRLRAGDAPVTSPSTVPNRTEPNPTVPDRTAPAAAAAAPAREAPEVTEKHTRAYRAWDRQAPGGLNPTIVDHLNGLIENGTPIEWIELACESAAEQGGRKSWGYIKRILERYEREGFDGAADDEPAPPAPVGDRFLAGLRTAHGAEPICCLEWDETADGEWCLFCKSSAQRNPAKVQELREHHGHLSRSGRAVG